MANMKIKTNEIPDLLNECTRFGNDIFKVAKKIVNSTEPIVVGSYRGAIEGAASRGYSRGGTSGSIHWHGAKKNAYGVFSAAYPTGSSVHPLSWGKTETRHGLRAAIMQYGRSGRMMSANSKNNKGYSYAKNGNRQYYVYEQRRSPWLEQAVSAASAPASALMEQSFNQEVENYFRKGKF